MARSARVAPRRSCFVASVVVVVAFLVGLGACDKGRDATPPPTEAQAKGAPPLAGAAFYRVDAGRLPPCTPGATCEAELVLTALGDYKVNADYPTKFVADHASEVAIEGYAFKRDGDKRGRLTVRFTPRAAGAAKLVGIFKLSVCTEENCEIEAPQITLQVTSS